LPVVCYYTVDWMGENHISLRQSPSFGDLKRFPRSVQWRIHLGLLKGCPDSDANAGNPSVVVSSTSLEDVYKWNSEFIAQQQGRFKELMAKYVEEEQEEHPPDPAASLSPVAATPNKNNNNPGGGDPLANSNNNNLDPLTAMFMEQEAQETRKQELYLKYRKERARRKRGLSSPGGGAYTGGDESDDVDRVSVRVPLRVTFLLQYNCDIYIY
jgi:hypothetical protein